jgi:predicted Zn-dependent protease
LRQTKIAAAAPPPISVEGVRPRVISAARPPNAAAASLRQSAAVGETYLNDLLTGGLLEVAGVRVPDQEFDLRPDRRWGRSTRRAFAFLFVVLVLGIGGGGTWYWWTEKQKREAVARLQTEAKTALGTGDFAGLETSKAKLKSALDKDETNLLTYAYIVETAGLEALLYGTDTASGVDTAIKAIGKDIQPGDPGSRELVIGRAAVELSRLSSLQAAPQTVAEVIKMLDDYLAKNEGDKWARWLKARALLAAGDRSGAKAALKAAAAEPDGLPLAMIDQADLLVDEGALKEAFDLYDKVLKIAKDHPLAVLGKSLARAESSLQSEEAINDLKVTLEKNLGPRVAAYKNLGLAFAQAAIEDYPRSVESLKLATGSHPPQEPRFLARVAWAHFARGELAAAAAARNGIKWYRPKPQDDPTVVLVDAALLLASGLPNKALDVATKIEGVRPRLLRAYADLDLGKAKDALTELDWVLDKAPDNLEAQVLRAETKMVSGTERERIATTDVLEKLARKTKSKLGRHALGIAYFIIGDPKNAQPQLEQALQVTDEEPNPVAYRTRTALADILLAQNNIEGAGKQIDEAVKLNPGYYPALALQPKIVLKNGEPEKALEYLSEYTSKLAKDHAAPPPAVLLLNAEALCARKDAKASDKDEAEKLLAAIKDKIQPPTEVGRVAAICDPKLPEKLGVPSETGAPKPQNKGRRRR